MSAKRQQNLAERLRAVAAKARRKRQAVTALDESARRQHIAVEAQRQARVLYADCLKEAERVAAIGLTSAQVTVCGDTVAGGFRSSVVYYYRTNFAAAVLAADLLRQDGLRVKVDAVRDGISLRLSFG